MLADGWGQSKITTGFAAATVCGDFTLTPEFIAHNLILHGDKLS